MSIIFSDFDGTLTDKHHLSPVFFEILDTVKNQGHELIVVSGRSISWGHFLLTHFPMDVAIMEGGGAILIKDKRGIIREDLMISEDELFGMDELTIKLIKVFPGCPLSVDSYGRKTDRAIELEEVNRNMIKKITDFFDDEGVHHSQSNVHINFWNGNFDKFKAIEYFLKTYRSQSSLSDCLFFGDSLNDESVFEKLPRTIGVSNIKNTLTQLKHHPSYIMLGEENSGPQGVLNYLKSCM